MDVELEFRRQLIESRCGCTISFALEGLEELKFFVATLEGFIAREEAREVAEAEVYAHSHDFEAGADFWAENHPYWWEQIFASRLRSAYIVSLMAVVEQHLREVCRDAATILNIDSPQVDRGGLIRQYRRFLQREVNFKSPDQKTWESIRYVYDLRNAFVHNGGMLREANDRARIRQLAKRAPGLKIENDVFLDLGADFVGFANNSAAELFSGLALELVSLCERTGG